MRESKRPRPAFASCGAKTALRAVFRAGEIPRAVRKVEGVEAGRTWIVAWLRQKGTERS